LAAEAADLTEAEELADLLPDGLVQSLTTPSVLEAPVLSELLLETQVDLVHMAVCMLPEVQVAVSMEQ
jgi:hypothetical protein